MPAWATVAITLGGAAIGALAGIAGALFAARTARLSLEHERRESWRTRSIEVAREFIKIANSMTFQLNLALIEPTVDLRAIKVEDFYDDLGTLREAEGLVWITFGRNSDTGTAADHVVEEVMNMLDSLRYKTATYDQLRDKLEAAHNYIGGLLNVAHFALDPSP